MAAVVSPLLHTYEVPPDAVMFAEAPSQMTPSLTVVPEFSATLIEAMGLAVTVAVAVAVQPLLAVTVTVYTVVAVTLFATGLAMVVLERNVAGDQL